MGNNFIEDGAFVNSIVGEGTKLKGELELNGLLRIDGDFSGTIKTNGKVLVGKNGRVQCTITASTVVVGGAMKGNICASEKVIIFSSGIVFGSIYTPRLIAEEGVILHGNCVVKSDYADSFNLLTKAPEITTAPESAPEPENGEQKTENSGSYTQYESTSEQYEKESEEKAQYENITKSSLL